MVCLVNWIYGLVVFVLNTQTPFNEQALFLMHIGSLIASLSLHCLLMKINVAFAEYTILFIVGVRCIETFLVMHLIDQKTPGFELIDRKELVDAIPFIATPGFGIG